MEILVGADPELFAFNNDIPVSAYGLIQGSKHDPFKVKDGAVQVDGMALEFNIDPAKNEAEFIKNLNSVMQTLRDMVPGYNVRATPVAEFGFDYIQQQPAEAIELGCEPDFDAWANGDVNEPPNALLPFRTGAGHVHVGWTKDADTYTESHMKSCVSVIKQLDFFLGLPSLFYDNGTKRRIMYGKPGCFRPKSYGAEYRVLSNQWLGSDELKGWVFRNTQAAMNRHESGDLVYTRVNRNILKNLMDEKPDLVRVRRVLDKLDIEIPKAA